jgi:hypothetical protein
MFTLRGALGARRVVAAPQVTHSLTRTLRRRAERLAPRPILVGPARVRAGHLRRTRRWTVAAVVLVVGAAFAMPASLGGRDRAGEGGSRRTSVSLAAARTRTSNVPPLRALPAGTAPRIGWLDADGYHPAADVAIVVPGTLTTVVSSGRDLVGVRSGHEASQLVPLTAGSLVPPERRATTPVVSADGSAIAWYARHGREGTLTVVRGDGSHSVDVRAVAPLGFARADGGPLLLTEPGATSDLSVVRRLLPGTGAIDPRWNRPGIGVAVSPVTGDLVVLRPWSLGSCFVLLGPEGRTRWRACTPAVGDRPPPEWVGALGPFSPDGRYLLARGIPREVGNGAFAVIDVRTGRVLHRYDTSAAALRMFGDAVFEDDGHVLVAMYERGSTALVRCDFHGHCESATTPVRTPAQRWTSHPFGRT